MIAEQTYLKPKSTAEAIACAQQHRESFRYLAGGTDILVNMFQENVQADCLIDITDIEELKKVSLTEDLLRIGALVRLEALKGFPEITQRYPALLQAAHAVGSPLVRKTATLGGNLLCENRCSFYNQSEWWRTSVGYCLKCDGDICIATGGKKACFSKFVSDTAPVLIALHASLEIADADGGKTIPLEELYTGDGLRPTTLIPGALLQYVVLPTRRRIRCAFRKLRVREAVDFTSLTTAVSVCAKGKVRIVIGGVDPGPVLIEGTGDEDPEALIAKAAKKCRVVDNDVFSRKYRKAMIPVYLRDCFNELESHPT